MDFIFPKERTAVFMLDVRPGVFGGLRGKI
jgi:hypothetical protein